MGAGICPPADGAQGFPRQRCAGGSPADGAQGSPRRRRAGGPPRRRCAGGSPADGADSRRLAGRPAERQVTTGGRAGHGWRAGGHRFPCRRRGRRATTWPSWARASPAPPWPCCWPGRAGGCWCSRRGRGSTPCTATTSSATCSPRSSRRRRPTRPTRGPSTRAEPTRRAPPSRPWWRRGTTPPARTSSTRRARCPSPAPTSGSPGAPATTGWAPPSAWTGPTSACARPTAAASTGRWATTTSSRTTGRPST